MRILGMEIPDAVAAVIVAKAKTGELFKEFIEEFKWEWKFAEMHDSVIREIEFRRKKHPMCKIAIKFEYHSDSLEIGYKGVKDYTVELSLFVNAYDMRKSHNKLYNHIKETYGMTAEDYPTLFIDDGIVELAFNESSEAQRLISDIKEAIPKLEIELIANSRIRIKV